MKVAVRYSTVCEDELLMKLAPLYQIDHPRTCHFWHRGGDDIYQLRSDTHCYTLRVYRHGIHARDDIEFEVAALNFLRSRGAKVAYPIEKRDGGYISEIEAPEGLRYVVITTHAHGSVPGYCGQKHIYERDACLFGESVAELHELSEGFECNHERRKLDIDYLFESSVEVVRTYIRESALFLHKERADSQEKLHAAILAVKENLLTVIPDDLDVGFCHGDCHGSNVHNDNGELTQFDFEDCGFGYRVYDIATFKWAIHGEDKENELWSSFLKGYASIRQPGSADLLAIPVFVIIRQLWWIAFIISNLEDFGYIDTSDRFVCKQLSRIESMLKYRIE